MSKQVKQLQATVWKDKKVVSFISRQCKVRGDSTVLTTTNTWGKLISATKSASGLTVLIGQKSGGDINCGFVSMSVLSMPIF